MDKNDLYNAFDKIDPALVARAEQGSCFAAKKAKRSFAEKGRGRMIIPLIIVPLALIAAITVISVASYKNRTPKGNTVTGPTPLPAETDTATPEPVPSGTEAMATGQTDTPSPAAPTGSMPWTYVPSDGSQLPMAMDSYLKSSGFADAEYPNGFDRLSAKLFTTLSATIIGDEPEFKFEKYNQDGIETQSFYDENHYLIAENNSRDSVRYLAYVTHAELNALPLPFEIDFGDSFIEVMDKMGVAFPENAGDSFSISAKTDSNGFAETYEINFYRTDRTNLGPEGISFNDPSYITYAFTQKNGAGQITLQRTMSFLFGNDDPSLSGLASVHISVRERDCGDTEANVDGSEISSAVEFMSAPDMIIEASKIPEYKRPEVNSVFEYNGYSYYYGYTPNAFSGKRYAMRILSKEQSEALLSAPDITKISYLQSECLIKMLNLDRVSVDLLPIESNTVTVRGAYYFYLDDSVVIVAVDTLLLTSPLNDGEADGSRILVIPEDEASEYPFQIPAEGYSFEESDECGTYYSQLFDYFVEKARVNAA